MSFPELRMRRLRRTPTWRRLVRETRLTVDDLISPLFVCPGEGVDRPIGSMPGCSQLSVDRLVEECRELFDLGIGAVILFGIPETKDARGSSSWSEEGIVQQALRSLKEALPELVLLADVCFCEYTDHGHCGILEGEDVANDPTLEITVRQALSLADAGADCLAPSGMMDGVVHAIRFGLDESGFEETPILSYAAKYASAFYGPFREAAGSAPSFGDRRSYQMDAANVEEALREVALDLEEGADLVMVKPAMAFLDVVTRVKETFEVPVAAYNVSGEYAMVKAAAEKGWIDEVQVRDELLVSMKRAGADLILTYFAKDVARSFRGGSA